MRLVSLKVGIEDSGHTPFELIGGPKDLERLHEPANATERLVRDDGGVLHFTLAGDETRAGINILAYDFELYFPKPGSLQFVRYDLNLPGHTNDLRAMRCHLHPGSDDHQVAAPRLSPLELLDLLVFRVRPLREERSKNLLLP